jgi:osmotically inducible lipoprotein OsmB
MIKKVNLQTFAAAVCIATLASCNGLDTREQRMLTGGAIGAGVGAAAAGVTGGSVGTGALIGAGAGAVGGYIYDKNH